MLVIYLLMNANKFSFIKILDAVERQTFLNERNTSLSEIFNNLENNLTRYELIYELKGLNEVLESGLIDSCFN
jgi:hypothetical protein